MDPQQTHKCKLKQTLILQKINHLMNIYTNNIKRNEHGNLCEYRVCWKVSKMNIDKKDQDKITYSCGRTQLQKKDMEYIC